MNTHVYPDRAVEVQACFADLFAPRVLGTSLTLPGAGQTLPAFAAQAYVLTGSPACLRYVNQASAPVTLIGGNGTYWVAVHHDTHSAVAQWNRVPATHYLWRAGPAEQPTDPPGGLVVTSVTVAEGTIVAFDANVSYPAQKVAYGGPHGQLAFDEALVWNGTGLTVTGEIQTNILGVTGGTTLGGGLAVTGPVSAASGAIINGAITTNELGVTGDATIGGTLDVSGAMSGNGGATITGLVTANDLSVNSVSTNSLGVVGAPGNMNVVGNVEMGGRVGIGGAPSGGAVLYLQYPKNTDQGLMIRPTIDDNGAASPILFLNVAGTVVGSIQTNATGTTYNTTSDARLKHDIAPMTGALELLRRLNPITHLWNADDSRGYGLLAHELQRELPSAVMGAPDAVQDDGSIQPQQVDYSKLVPWLVSAVQALAARLEVLEVRPMTALESPPGA